MAKVTKIEYRSLEKETQEKAGEIFKILKEKGLAVQEFSGLFKMFNDLQKRKLREHKESAWHIKEGKIHWWNSFLREAMFISLSTNTITFIAPLESSLLPKIRDVAEQIKEGSNFEVKIVTY